MATTVTDHRVVPVTFLFWDLYLVETFVVVDGDEISKTRIALFLDEVQAGLDAQRRGRQVVED